MDYEKVLKAAGVIDANACMEWAFGEGFGVMALKESNNVWNGRHGDLFELKDSDFIVNGLEKIGLAFVDLVQGSFT